MWYNKKFFKGCVSILLVLTIIFLGYQLFPLFASVVQFITTLLFPVIIAGLFYYIFRPIVHYFDTKKVPRYLSILLIYLGMIILLSIIIGAIWPYVGKQINEFSAFPNEKIKEVENKTVYLMDLFNFYSLSHEQLRQILLVYLQKITTWLTTGFINNFSSVTKVASYIIVTPFILFYFLRDDKNVTQTFMKIVHPDFKVQTKKVLNDIDEVLSGYISGQVLVAVIVGFLIFVGYLIIGLDYAFLLALTAFVFNLIPFGGPIISTVPALFIGLAQSPFMAFKVVCIVIMVHLLDLNLISPRIVGQRLNIHPITIILLLVASISLFGFLSLFFIVPLYAVLRVLILDLIDVVEIEPPKTS